MSALLAVVLLTPATSTDTEDLLERHGWGTPARDPALDRVAVDLARRFSGPTDGPVPAGAERHLEHLKDVHRVGDVQVVPFTVRHRDARALARELPKVLTRLDRRFPPTHYGVGTYGLGGALTTTVLLVHRGVTLDAPPPREASPGDALSLGGALRRGYFRPRVLVAPPPPYPILDRPAWTDSQRAEVTLYFDRGPGIYRVELVADSRYGPVVLSNLAVHVGVTPPLLPVVKLSPPVPVGPPAPQLGEHINRLRAARRLPPLIWDDALAAVASAHAADIAKTRTLAHALPDSGTLSTRLQAAGLGARVSAENLASARSPAEAMRAFEHSPGHTRNLLLPGLTHLGVGLAGRYYVVVLIGR